MSKNGWKMPYLDLASIFFWYPDFKPRMIDFQIDLIEYDKNVKSNNLFVKVGLIKVCP